MNIFRCNGSWNLVVGTIHWRTNTGTITLLWAFICNATASRDQREPKSDSTGTLPSLSQLKQVQQNRDPPKKN